MEAKKLKNKKNNRAEFTPRQFPWVGSKRTIYTHWNNYYFSKKRSIVETERGFTLIEILLVFALLAILVAITVPLAISFMRKNDMEISTEIVAESLRRAQSLSFFMNHDSSWGVEFSNNQVVVFAGSNFSARNAALDETFSFPSFPINFSKESGLSGSSSSITITNSSGESRSITINEAGAVFY